MNKGLFFLLGICFLSSGSFAQTGVIEGAVSFKKSEPVEEVAPQKNVLNQNDFNRADALAKVTAKTEIWDNPRFVKIYYGQLKGTQQAIDRVQQKELDKQSFPNEATKEEAKEQMKKQTLIRFEDYSEEPEVVHKKMNQNPRAALLDMASRISFIDSKQMTTERSKAIKNTLLQDFYDKEGLTVEEYMNAERQQLKQTAERISNEDEKAQTFPILDAQKEVKVEKVDEQNALLRVSVGAPRSKKE